MIKENTAIAHPTIMWLDIWTLKKNTFFITLSTYVFCYLQLQYSILSGNKANLVYLNESTGLLTLSPYLDTNVPLTAKIEVLVSGKYTFWSRAE
jgi:hypothetical protein